MEAKLNIVEILKDKPKGTKLYSPLFGNVYFSDINNSTTYVLHHTSMASFYSDATFIKFEEAEPLLFPSKEMRDWSKFAWKKGDVLVSKGRRTLHVIFEGFNDDTYTTFKGKHYICDYLNREDYNDEKYYNDYHKEVNERTIEFEQDNVNKAQNYINIIEKKLGGKLNRETLEIEQWKSKFNDGDIVVLDANKCYAKCILILRGDLKIYNQEECISYYTFYNTECCNMDLRTSDVSIEYSHLRLATDSEKQQLFNALAKKGKRWDAKKKQIVNLTPKADKLKPFDKVLVKDEYYGSWEPAFFWKEVDVEDLHPYMIIGGKRYRYCEPYEGNENILDY